MHPNNWPLATLRSLSISFRPASQTENSDPLIPPTDCDRLFMLRALIRDPKPFLESGVLPGFPNDSINNANVALAQLSWPCLRFSSPSRYLRDIVYNIIDIFNFTRLGIEHDTLQPLMLNFNSASTSAIFDTLITFITICPLIAILNLPPPPKPGQRPSIHNRRRFTEATVAAYLLTLAQNYYRTTDTLCLPERPPAQPCLLAARWLRTGAPVYIIFTTQIPLSYLNAVEAHLETPGIAVSWQEFDATDDGAMVALLEVLLRLIPALVMRVVEAAGGEHGTKALRERYQELKLEQFMAKREAARWEEEKRGPEWTRAWTRGKPWLEVEKGKMGKGG